MALSDCRLASASPRMQAFFATAQKVVLHLPLQITGDVSRLAEDTIGLHATLSDTAILEDIQITKASKDNDVITLQTTIQFRVPDETSSLELQLYAVVEPFVEPVDVATSTLQILEETERLKYTHGEVKTTMDQTELCILHVDLLEALSLEVEAVSTDRTLLQVQLTNQHSDELCVRQVTVHGAASHFVLPSPFPLVLPPWNTQAVILQVYQDEEEETKTTTDSITTTVSAWATLGGYRLEPSQDFSWEAMPRATADDLRVELRVLDEKCTVGEVLTVQLSITNEAAPPLDNLMLRVPQNDDDDLMPIDIAKLLGKLPTGGSVESTLRFLPWKGGTLAVPPLELVHATSKHVCRHKMRVFVA